MNITRKKRREQNREKINAQARVWRAKNKEKVKAMKKRYYEQNKEKVLARQRAYMKEWRKNNPEKCKAYAEKWKASNQDKIQASRERHYLSSINQHPCQDHQSNQEINDQPTNVYLHNHTETFNFSIAGLRDLSQNALTTSE